MGIEERGLWGSREDMNAGFGRRNGPRQKGKCEAEDGEIGSLASR